MDCRRLLGDFVNYVHYGVDRHVFEKNANLINIYFISNLLIFTNLNKTFTDCKS